jgi:hypothetical protein
VTGEPGTTGPLGRLVSQEARRLLTEAALAPDPRRVAAGWTRRFVTDVGRAEESMTLYRALGYEVAADPLRPEEMPEDCETCELALRSFRTIYTRRPTAGTGDQEAR